MIEGCQKTITILRRNACTSCSGHGSLNGTHHSTCSSCNGRGKTFRVQNVAFGQVRSEITCSACSGRGKIIQTKCETCKATGYIDANETVQVDIPAGVVAGDTLQNHGLGHNTPGADFPGDLYITVDDLENVAYVS